METLTKQAVLDIVETYIKTLKGEERINKSACRRAWYIITNIIMPLNKDFPNDDVDAKFIIQALCERGIDKQQKKLEPSFHELLTEKPKDPREHCPYCDIYGGLGCPNHRY